MSSTTFTLTTNLHQLLTSIEEELGGYFQIQQDKAQWGVGDDLGKRASYLDDIEAESLNGLWFSNRLFPAGVTDRLSDNAIQGVRFIRFDMERSDHSPCTEEEAIEVIEFFRSVGARAAIRTPRGVHAYVITDKSLLCEKGARNTVKAFAFWLLKSYTGSLVVDMPTWHPSCVSRCVDTLEFVEEGAIVEVPDDVMAAWNKEPEVIKGRFSDKSTTEEKGSLSGRLECSKAMRAYAMGMDSSEASVFSGLAVAKVESIWSAYAKPELKYSLGSVGDNEECLTSDYLGPTSDTRRIRQRTYTPYANRWWGFFDYYSEIGEWRPDVLKQDIMQLPQFSLIREKARKNYKLKNDEELSKFMIKSIDQHTARFEDSFEGTTVSEETLEKVSDVISIFEMSGTESVTTAEFTEALNDSLSQRQVLRALQELESRVEHNGLKGPGSSWKLLNKVVDTEAKDGKEEKPVEIDFDKEIISLLSSLNLKIKLIVGGAGSGKTETLKKSVLFRKVQKEGELVETDEMVPALVMAPTNEIAIELEQKRLHRAVKTIHTGMSIEVLKSVSDWTNKWSTKKKVRSRLVVIDEFSLVSKKLFYQVLCRLKPTLFGKKAKDTKLTTLVLVGDFNQLPPVTDVDGDYPLRDLIAMAKAGKLDMELEELEGNQRASEEEASGIPAAAFNVLLGLNPEEGPGFEMVEIPENDDSGDPASERLMESAAELLKYKQSLGEDWKCYSTLKGEEYGAQNIAHRVVGRTEILGDRMVMVDGKEVKTAGDMVVCQVTDKNRDIIKGLLGRVTKSDTYGQTKYRVQFKRYDDEGEAYHMSRWLPREDIARAEARNAHVVQGTQCDNVIIALEFSRVCSIEMLYMLITRARKKVILLYTSKSLHRALRNRALYTVSPWAKHFLQQ